MIKAKMINGTMMKRAIRDVIGQGHGQMFLT
jgi:hypothetical protein